MNESLKMLRTTEGQMNAVFACFGSAAQHAQLFESALAEFLIAYNSVVKAEATIEELEAIMMANEKKTMGRLLSDLRKHVTFNEPEIDRKLSEALKTRNLLMHEFFLERDDCFASEAGRIGMLAELASIQSQFEETTLWIGGLRIAMLKAVNAKENSARKNDSEVVFSVDIKSIDLPPSDVM